jgi:hypothetical protein
MIRKIRTKRGGEKIPVTLGDFADVPVQGLFNLIYVVFNTFFALLTQEASLQRRNMHAEHRHSNNGRDRGAKACDTDCYPIGACQGPPMSQEDASETAADMCDEEKCRQRIMGNQSRVP